MPDEPEPCHHWSIDTFSDNVALCRDCGKEFTYLPVDPETAVQLRKAFGLDLPRITVDWPDAD